MIIESDGLKFYLSTENKTEAFTKLCIEKYNECEYFGKHLFVDMIHFEDSHTGEVEFCCSHCKLIEE